MTAENESTSASTAGDLLGLVSPSWYPISAMPRTATRYSAPQMVPGIRFRKPTMTRFECKSITSLSDWMKRPVGIDLGSSSAAATAWAQS